MAVVIPLFNGAAHIEEALAGVCAQSAPPQEVIVVDDGSTDDGPDRARRFAGRLPLKILQKANGGQSAARNLGVAEACSDWIAFLDQDDVWHPQHLANLRAAADNGPAQTGWAYCDVSVVDAAGRLLAPSLLHRRPGRHPKQSVDECLAQDMFVLPSAALVARHAFLAVGGFDERLSGYEDDDLFLRLLCAGFHSLHVEEPTVLRRSHAEAASRSIRMERSLMIYARKLLAVFPDRPQEGRFPSRDLIAPRFCRTLLARWAMAERAGNREAAALARAGLRELLPHLGPHRRRIGAVILHIASMPVVGGACLRAAHGLRQHVRRTSRP
ncbi:glycosyltransferase family 2 protein [Chelatococcus sp. CO-6]|uniref:glycosyltransferase family 2 protein n=3 Tax=unclassified Chelatococcus TaxID=2638111 RepID=UPI00069E9C98|nr:glycosyltransferase family A protein [Chelatococcus sp. CO-6]